MLQIGSGRRASLARGHLGWVRCAGIVLGLVAIGLPTPSPAAGAPMAPAVYYSSHGAESLSVVLGRIGILAADGAPIDSLMSFAANNGLLNPDTLSARIFTFRVGPSTPRDSLALLARRLKQGQSGLIAEAGMAIIVRGGRKPLIVTDKFIVQFKSGVTKAQIDSINNKNEIAALEANVLKPNHYLLSVTDRSTFDAIDMANYYQQQSDFVEYSHPNFIHLFLPRAAQDPLYENQWHLHNVGQRSGGPTTRGTPDADIDWPEAWEIATASGVSATTGSVTIAVIDGGFNLEHEDLRGSLWVNEAESTGTSGVDDDGNGYVDDVHGYDFVSCDGTTGSPPGCGDGDPSINPSASSFTAEYGDDRHGTPVAGLVGMTMGNYRGGIGACPSARLMLIRKGYDEEHIAQAFGYATQNGASVINCSWGDAGTGTDTPTLNGAIDDADAKGVSVVFAISYTNAWNDLSGNGNWDLAERPSVIAVGGSTNYDRRWPESSYGNYVDLLSPAGRGTGGSGYGDNGTLDITTTSAPDGPPAILDRAYTSRFVGTSAAAPLVAGVVGLVRSVKSGLTTTMIRRLLQDTADKIEPSEAGYDPRTGFSHPVSQKASTHGYGRVNAFEAVRVAAPTRADGRGGRGGVDLFVRDNPLDWGNTEQPSSVTFEQTRGFEPYWESMDIKVDRGPSFQPNPTETSSPSVDFDTLVDEPPLAGGLNRVYVRVRNRGTAEAHQVKVRLYWAYAGSSSPTLPDYFWSSFGATATSPSFGEWTLIGEQTLSGNLLNSGATVAREARASGGDAKSDVAAVLEFADWATPLPSGELFGRGVQDFSFLVIVDSPDDHVSPYQKILDGRPIVPHDFDVDALVASDNNVTLKTVTNWKPSGPTVNLVYTFYLRNPTNLPIDVKYSVEAPAGWTSSSGDLLEGVPARLEPKAKTPISLMIGAPPGASGDIRVFEYSAPAQAFGSSLPSQPTGGVTLHVVGAPASVKPVYHCPWWLIILLAVLLLIAIIVIVWLVT